MLVRLKTLIALFLLVPLLGCIPASLPDVSSAKSFRSSDANANYMENWSDQQICTNATTSTGAWDYRPAFKEYLEEAQKRDLDCLNIASNQNSGEVKTASTITNSSTLASSSNQTTSSNSVTKVLTSSSSGASSKLQLSDDEGLTLVMASVFHSKPDNAHSYGQDAGYVGYCKNVSNSKARQIRSNLVNWLKLGSTEFESFDGRKGFLNQRKFNKLLEIFEDAERQGKRDGRIMSSNAAREFRELCDAMLSDEALDGPSRRLMTLVRE